MKYDVKISKMFRDGTTADRFKRIDASSVEEASKSVYVADGESVTGIEIVPERDPYAFDMSLFRKEFRENVTALNEDDIADYHAKIERGEIVLDPAKASESTLTTTEIIVESEETVGALVEYDNQQWLCTHVIYISAADAAEAADGHDVFVSPGWHSTLVRLDTDVMTVLSEQYATGAALFTSPSTVKFADEQYATPFSDLAYSAKIGLYNKSQIKPATGHGGHRPGAGRPPKGQQTKLGTQEQLIVYAKQIAVYRGYTDLVNGLQPAQRLRDKYFAEIAEFKEALSAKTWQRALHESSDVLYYAACIDAASGSTLYLNALREAAQLLRFHGVRVSAAQIEAAALAKYAWRAAGKDNKDEAHELLLIEQAVSK